MNAVNTLSSAASVTYATQLAQASSFKRSLNNLDEAIQNGDLTSAGSVLGAFVKANPQFVYSATDAASQAPINQNFQTLTDAIASDQVDPAKSAWALIQSDLAKNGVTDLNSAAASTATILAQTNTAISQQILSNAFGSSSSGNLSISSLLGGSSVASGGAGASGSWLNDWLTYKASGNTAPLPTPASASNNLNVVA